MDERSEEEPGRHANRNESTKLKRYEELLLKTMLGMYSRFKKKVPDSWIFQRAFFVSKPRNAFIL